MPFPAGVPVTLRLIPVLTLAALLAACSAGVPPGAAIAQPASGLEALGAAKSQPLRAAGVAGDVRVHRDVASKNLARKRDVFVYVPPGYTAASSQRYPVLYMHDGNNLFDPAQAFMGHEWQIDESMEALLAKKQIPPMIVVGVANTPDRMDEYTWVPGELDDGKRAGGNGAKYGKFLVEELKPMIDKAYRTKPGRTDTGVMGSSLGGLQSLYLGRHHGATFGKIGVMSPSVWWADKAVLQEPAKFPRDLRIWLDFGHREGSDPAAGLANARALDRGLEARGYDKADLKFWEDREGGHDEQAWAYRFPIAMTWLFGADGK